MNSVVKMNIIELAYQRKKLIAHKCVYTGSQCNSTSTENPTSISHPTHLIKLSAWNSQKKQNIHNLTFSFVWEILIQSANLKMIVCLILGANCPSQCSIFYEEILEGWMGKASLFQELLNKGADGNLSDSPLVNLLIATGNFTIIAGC